MMQKGLERFAKLSCRWRYGRLLSAHLDDELDSQATEAIAGHLRECGRCRDEFEQLRFTHRALVEFGIPPMRSPTIAGNVFRLPALKEVSLLKRLYSQKVTLPLPLAAALLITLISAALFVTTRFQRTIQSTASVPAPPSVEIKVVEVRVERVVTRTVYLKQPVSARVRSAPKVNEFLSTPPKAKGEIAQNEPATPEWSNSALKDFRPAASANLRVVKEHEK